MLRKNVSMHAVAFTPQRVSRCRSSTRYQRCGARLGVQSIRRQLTWINTYLLETLTAEYAADLEREAARGA
jgi:hypothetical protein